MNLALKLAALGMDMEGVPEQSFLELKGRTKHNLLENIYRRIMEHAKIYLGLGRAWVFIL